MWVPGRCLKLCRRPRSPHRVHPPSAVEYTVYTMPRCSTGRDMASARGSRGSSVGRRAWVHRRLEKSCCDCRRAVLASTSRRQPGRGLLVSRPGAVVAPSSCAPEASGVSYEVCNILATLQLEYGYALRRRTTQYTAVDFLQRSDKTGETCNRRQLLLNKGTWTTVWRPGDPARTKDVWAGRRIYVCGTWFRSKVSHLPTHRSSRT